MSRAEAVAANRHAGRSGGVAVRRCSNLAVCEAKEERIAVGAGRPQQELDGNLAVERRAERGARRVDRRLRQRERALSLLPRAGPPNQLRWREVEPAPPPARERERAAERVGRPLLQPSRFERWLEWLVDLRRVHMHSLHRKEEGGRARFPRPQRQKRILHGSFTRIHSYAPSVRVH